jgi:hypothetical protein
MITLAIVWGLKRCNLAALRQMLSILFQLFYEYDYVVIAFGHRWGYRYYGA